MIRFVSTWIATVVMAAMASASGEVYGMHTFQDPTAIPPGHPSNFVEIPPGGTFTWHFDWDTNTPYSDDCLVVGSYYYDSSRVVPQLGTATRVNYFDFDDIAQCFSVPDNTGPGTTDSLLICSLTDGSGAGTNLGGPALLEELRVTFTNLMTAGQATALYPDAGFIRHGSACQTDTFGSMVTGTVWFSVPDTDGDGVWNGSDNCPQHANAGQENVAGSDYLGVPAGDACDADYDEDGVVGGIDFGRFSDCFAVGTVPDASLHPDTTDGLECDHDGPDGSIGGVEFGLFRECFAASSGPGSVENSQCTD